MKGKPALWTILTKNIALPLPIHKLNQRFEARSLIIR
jgi:RNAse (barnase) inhibitor barstar